MVHEQGAVLGSLDGLVNPAAALVGPGIVQEVAHFADGRNPAIEIERQPAEEFGVVGKGGRRNPLRGPMLGEEPIDPGR